MEQLGAMSNRCVVSERRKTSFWSLIGRRPKPPDIHSIEFSKLVTDLSILKTRFYEKELEVETQRDEIVRLRAHLHGAMKERDDAKYALVEERMVKNDLENRKRRLEKRLEVMTGKFEDCQSELHTMKEFNSDTRSIIGQLEQQLNETKEKLINTSKAVEMVHYSQRELLGMESKVDEMVIQQKELEAQYQQLRNEHEKCSVNPDLTEDKRATESELKSTIQKRCTIFNEIQDLRGNVRVFCRVRPHKLFNTQSSAISIPASDTSNTWDIACNQKVYSFNHVFDTCATNRDVYKETAGVVEMVMRGTNVCILAYGQTGSGKTHTMDGNKYEPGINMLALRHLFQNIGDEPGITEVSLSILEVYNDCIQDLLISGSGPKSKLMTLHQPSGRLGGLQITRDPHNHKKNQIPGLTTVRVQCLDDVQKFLRKAKARRSVSSTSMNTSSSRSHLILEVSVQRSGSNAKLNLVDLAGSERINRSNVDGKRRQESIHINKSLSSLGKIFAALEKRSSHVPYRDCKLTHFLKDSIGGGAKTLMFIMVSGESDDKNETCATLEFGKRVRSTVVSHEPCE